MNAAAWPQRRTASGRAPSGADAFPAAEVGSAGAGLRSGRSAPFRVSPQQVPAPCSVPAGSGVGAEGMEAKFTTKHGSFVRTGKGSK